MKRILISAIACAALTACGNSSSNDPVADVIAGYTAADSAAASFLAVQTNAATKAAVQVCEAAAYTVLEPVKVAWVAKQPVAPAALSAAQATLTNLQACLTSAGVKL